MLYAKKADDMKQFIMDLLRISVVGFILGVLLGFLAIFIKNVLSIK